MSLNTIIIVVLLVALVLYVISIYNRLVSLQNRYQNSFAQIEPRFRSWTRIN